MISASAEHPPIHPTAPNTPATTTTTTTSATATTTTSATATTTTSATATTTTSATATSTSSSVFSSSSSGKHPSSPPPLPLTAAAAGVKFAAAVDVVKGEGGDAGNHQQRQQQRQQQHQPALTVFLFINPSSGGNRASAFTRAGVSQLSLTSPVECEVYIYDIRYGSPGNKPGFLLLKETVDGRKEMEKEQEEEMEKIEEEGEEEGGGEEGWKTKKVEPDNKKKRKDSNSSCAKPIRVLVAGGDGTVMWCASELWAHDIDDSKVAVGVIPYGTGNDFAKAFGWKKYEACKPFDHRIATLRRLLQEWLAAEVVAHDLWEVTVDVEAVGGQFAKIDSKSRKKKIICDGETPVMRMTFIMSNYFSIGVESRIGIGFDRYRTQSQLCNKLRYVIEGFKKSAFKRTVKINDAIDRVAEGPTKPPVADVACVSKRDSIVNGCVLFTTNKTETHLPLLKPCMSLIVVNIPSFGAGNNIWAPSTKFGLKLPADHQHDYMKEIAKKTQDVGDGLVELVSFPSTAAIGLEFAFKGRGSRLFQGAGPFQIDFKDSLPASERVYFQVDGEFFHMQKPKRATIRHSRKIFVLKHP
eukprot:GHVS01076575.1.p1 GENE.GHVS01076575.1~~GHVS01076575.1.p1  ORF type:complete len:582 (-),score=169.80 GHVS01076575.1:203-1948(-)